MSANFQVELLEVTPARGRQRPTLRCRVIQAHPDAYQLRTLRDETGAGVAQFAGRLLADAPVPAFATAEPWLDDVRFPFLAKRRPVEWIGFTSHDLVALIDHDRGALTRLAELAAWPELDVEAQRELYGRATEPVDRDDPGCYVNFLDEAVLDLRLQDDPPPECVPGLRWSSAAF